MIILPVGVAIISLSIFFLYNNRARIGNILMQREDQITPHSKKKKIISIIPWLKDQQKTKKLVQELKNLQQSDKAFKSELEQLKSEAKKLSDPYFYREKKKQIEKKFIKNLQKIQLPQLQKTHFNKFIIGPISVGKSSLIKKFLNVNVKTGKGQITKNVQLVFENSSIRVFDSPGINQDYDIIEFKNITQLFEMDEFFLCYNSSLKNVNLILRVLSAITKKTNKNIYLVRTQCDNVSDEDQRTLEQQLKEDRKYIKGMLAKAQIGKQYQILATSAKRNLSFCDNQRLALLLNPTLQQNKLQEQNQKDIHVGLW